MTTPPQANKTTTEAPTVALSVNLMPDAPVGEIVELAVLAEDLGCSRCWVYDEGLVTRDVYVTLTAIASATSNIKLGPGITNPYVRHPAATATAIASLDELSGGRAFLGLGAGGALTLDPLAIDRSRPLTAVRDMVAALRRLFAGETVTHDGAAFSFHDARLSFARPDIDILLAGRGPRMTELGGQIADGFFLSYIHKELLGEHARALRSAAADRPFHISYATMIATDESQLDEARTHLTYRLADSPPEVKERIGMTAADTDAIRAALRAGGPEAARKHVRPEWVESFVISGTPAECAAELSSLMTTNGIDEFQLPVLEPDVGADLIERTAALLRP